MVAGLSLYQLMLLLSPINYILFNVLHVPCNRLIIQHLMQMHNQEPMPLYDVPPTCFGLYVAILREVYNKRIQWQRCAYVESKIRFRLKLLKYLKYRLITDNFHINTVNLMGIFIFRCWQISISICHPHSGEVISVLLTGAYTMADAWVLKPEHPLLST